MNEEKFSQILQTLLSPDNTLRKAAEVEFEAAKVSNATWVLSALVHILANEAPEEIHSISLPLLRKMFAKKDLTYDVLAPSQQETVKNNMVTAFTTLCQKKSLLSSVSACLAALAAKVHYLNQTWDELWQNLLSTIKNDEANPMLRAGSCSVIASCASTLEPYLSPCSALLVEGLSKCLSHPSCEILRREAAECVVSLVSTVQEASVLKTYAPLPMAILKGIELSLNENQTDVCVALLSRLCSFIERAPTVFTSSAESILDACMKIASTVELPDEVRHTAVEVLIVTCEETKLTKKMKTLATSVIDLLFNYMLNPTISEDWDETEEGEMDEVEGTTDFDIAVTGIDRVTGAVSAKLVDKHVQSLVQTNIQNPSWNHRQAALTLMTYSTEGLRASFIDHLEFAIDMVLSCINDENKVVRYAAFQCLSQMNTDFAPEIQRKYHAKYMTFLIKGLDDPVFRIADMAASAINSTYDEADDGELDADEGEAEKVPSSNSTEAADLLAPYIPAACQGLVTLYNKTTLPFVRTTALVAISSIISTSKKHMVPFVDDLLPLFNSILSQDEASLPPSDKMDAQALRNLKSRAIECATLLAGSVKFDHFSAYADGLCQFLVTMMSADLPNDDPRVPFILRGWTNMVDCMQDRVLPYMSHVLPRLFAIARMECDLEVEDSNVGDEEVHEEGVERMLVSLPGKGDIVVKTKTSKIEDKSTAANILCEILRLLKGKLSPYVQEMFEVAKDLISFCANSDIRVLGCELFEQLIEVCQEVAREQIVPFCISVVDIVVPAIKTEKEFSLFGNYLEILGKVAKACHGVQLPPEMLQKFSLLILELCRESGKRRSENKKERAAAEATGDADEEEIDMIDEMIENEEDILKNCQAAVESFLQYIPQFTTMFESDLFPLADEMLRASDSAIISVGISFFASYIEFSTSETVAARLDQIIPSILTVAQQNFAPDVQHNCFNCIRVTIGLLAKAYSQPHEGSLAFVTSAVDIIGQFLQSPKSRKETYFGATNNACAAAVSIIANFGQYLSTTCAGPAINANGPSLATVATGNKIELLFTTVVAHLPLGDADEVEAKRVHGALIEMIENNHPLACGPLRQGIIGKIREASPDCIDPEVLNKVKLMMPN